MRFIALGSEAGTILRYYLTKVPDADVEGFHFTFDPMDLTFQPVTLFDPATAPLPRPQPASAADEFYSGPSIYITREESALRRMRYNQELGEFSPGACSAIPRSHNRDPLFLPTLTTHPEEPRLHQILLGLPPCPEGGSGKNTDYAAAYLNSACDRAALSHVLAARTDPILFLACFGDPDAAIAPFALRLACEQNIPNQVAGTFPFGFEGTRRVQAAEAMQTEMREIRAEFGLPEALSLVRRETLGEHLRSHHGRVLSLFSAMDYCSDVTSDLLETLRQAAQ